MSISCDTIPGIGRLTAITILTELDPIARFAKADQPASYVGLIPMQHQSGSFRSEYADSTSGASGTAHSWCSAHGWL
ncbi:MAG: IS110 family transposase [Ignavibacteria bacterium]|nr:IS110 family transposase [Ignavibacteria bacterium]